MSFVALRFDATAESAESWADALLAGGAMSVDAADPHAGTGLESPRYGEPNTVDQGFWPVNRITALFPTGTDVESVFAKVSRVLGVAPPEHDIDRVEDDDWVRKTQAQFSPIRIVDGLWIVPSWCKPVVPDAINLMLDPGLAFGTGSHPTTRLCLEWLASHLRTSASVLDYGCGSGILAIAAARLGAREVKGVDVDTMAIEASRANAALNDVDAWFDAPDALTPGTFDIVVANILANPLQLLAPLLAGRVAPGGSIVLSGILEAQAASVAAAYERWFTITAWGTHDGWVALAGNRNDADG
jgi:ribosomal protein L11 methyltransferase